MIRKLEKGEFPLAARLTIDMASHSQDLNIDNVAIEQLKSDLDKDELAEEHSLYGAFLYQELVGLLAINENNHHVSMFFVKPEFQHQGIGKSLFMEAINNEPENDVVIDSPSFEIPFYQKFGFDVVGDKETFYGVEGAQMKKMTVH